MIFVFSMLLVFLVGFVLLVALVLLVFFMLLGLRLRKGMMTPRGRILEPEGRTKGSTSGSSPKTCNLPIEIRVGFGLCNI